MTSDLPKNSSFLLLTKWKWASCNSCGGRKMHNINLLRCSDFQTIISRLSFCEPSMGWAKYTSPTFYLCPWEYWFRLSTVFWGNWINTLLMTNAGAWLCFEYSTHKSGIGHILNAESAQGSNFCFTVVQKILHLEQKRGKIGPFTWTFPMVRAVPQCS